MDTLKNCRKCGRLFMSVGNTLFCNCCQKEEEKIFRSLREYVFDHPGIDVQELAARFNMNISRILRYVKEGKLTVLG